MNRKPIFDAVRAMLDRGFTPAEVKALDAAIDAYERGDDGAEIVVDGGAVTPPGHRLGKLSEKYETGGRGPGTVSSGIGDPGGVSYGCYQLASRTGTAKRFVEAEGAPWRAELSLPPGSAAFSAAWRAIAAREPERFAEAQHAFIERTHYRPAVMAVRAATGVDLDARHPAIRDVVWSCAVQHGRASAILSAAVTRAENAGQIDDDRALIEAIYDERDAYVRRIGTLPARTLNSLINRYAAERRDALAMLEN